MAEGNKTVFAGLNQTGLIVFIVLIVVPGGLCFCWLPWVIPSMKGDPQ